MSGWTWPLLAEFSFRAFHGIRERAARTEAGELVKTMRGFIAQLGPTGRPDRLVGALDAHWRPAWRVEMAPSYKAHRFAHDEVEKVPASPERQVLVLLKVLAATESLSSVGRAYDLYPNVCVLPGKYRSLST